MIGPPDQEMFEAYTLLGALAARTERVRLGTLVTGVTYRNPALLAKAVTAVDVISARSGAARHRCGVVRGGARRRSASSSRRSRCATSTSRTRSRSAAACSPSTPRRYAGTHHSVTDAWNSPAPINGRIPILIGGQGERKTFRLAAQYADELNINAAFVDLPRKLEALQGHLDDLGRERSSITVTPLGTMAVAETHDAARPS